jgi:hypothetical protein
MAEITDEDVREVQQELQRKALILDRYVKENVAVYTGRLRSSFQIEQLSNGGIRYFTNVGYAEDVERGSPPRVVPFEDLKRWVELVIQPDDELDVVTRRVQDKIAREGTEPQPFFRPALSRLRLEEFTE